MDYHYVTDNLLKILITMMPVNYDACESRYLLQQLYPYQRIPKSLCQ